MHDQKVYDRIVARVEKQADGCWLWTGPGWYKRPSPGNRYGYISAFGRSLGTHRAMWIAVHGPLTPEQYVCHKCDNPRCCNPEHLWIGSHKENMSDCRAKDRYYYANLTHCKRGHEFTPENTGHFIKGTNLRACKACQRGRLRVLAGWPEDLAYSLPPTPKGKRPFGKSWAVTRVGVTRSTVSPERSEPK